MTIELKDLYAWCRVPVAELMHHRDLRVPFRLVRDSAQMGEVMARDFVEEIKAANAAGRAYRAIVPCGPKCWYAPFTRLVNEEGVSLRNLFVFHMDECLDWQGRLLPKNDPFNFRTYMEEHFYGGIAPDLAVPLEQRFFPTPANLEAIKAAVAVAPLDLTIGGLGQDGHIAYNQARRHPYRPITLAELRNAELRIQENNWDTIIALAQREVGCAWEFVPPMSITIGVKECLSARKVRIYTDTGAWKQTALRVALFSPLAVEYPITLLQEHADALVTATYDTARHPIAENPGWQFAGVEA